MKKLVKFDSLPKGALFTLGKGTNVYRKTADGEYRNIQTNDLYVCRENMVTHVGYYTDLFKKNARVKLKERTGTIIKRRYVIHPLAGRQKTFDVIVHFDDDTIEILDPKLLILA